MRRDHADSARRAPPPVLIAVPPGRLPRTTATSPRTIRPGRGDRTTPASHLRASPTARKALFETPNVLPTLSSAGEAHHRLTQLPPWLKEQNCRRRPHRDGDKGYDYDHLRRWLRSRNITPRIARRGIESSQRLGRHRWTVERTVAWLAGCRRLHRRYERKAGHFLAFAGIAAALICYRRFAKVITPT
uniref:transposase n=1 Tax=Streptomyces corallincola TaxID=2851888 RepID=UPI003558D233